MSDLLALTLLCAGQCLLSGVGAWLLLRKGRNGLWPSLILPGVLLLIGIKMIFFMGAITDLAVMTLSAVLFALIILFGLGFVVFLLVRLAVK